MAQVTDVLVSSEELLDRLAAQQLRQKQLGMPNTAQGLSLAIVELMKLVKEASPSIDPSD